MPARTASAPVALLLLLLGALGTAEGAHAETEVYRPRHRLAAELQPLAQTALGADGHAVVDPGSNALVMVGTPESLAAARELLAEVDRALRNVEIHYARKTRSELEAEGVRVRWSAEAGPVRIGNAVRAEPGAEVRIAGREASGRDELSGRLRVLEGQTGRIETGSVVAYETGGRWHRRTELLEASSGFQVTPRILADGRVRLALRPYDARPTAEGGLAVHGAETELVLEPGETAVLGGLARDAARRADRDLSGSARSAGREELLLLVRVETP
ncbi:MAG: secretin N-terminal domain-containing protein [Myxococcota bacterium]|nr:secretin N-terminal domain-containing protein [Myxococcota bacterium]